MDVTEIKHACELHYGLSDTPFSLTPDTGFYVGLESHDEAFESVQYALAAGEGRESGGFVMLTGEVGTGKTLLCRRLLNHLESVNSDTAYIPNPTLSPTALWLAIGDELGLSGHTRLSQLRADIQRYLLNIAQEGRRLVLVIDEAQCLPPASTSPSPAPRRSRHALGSSANSSYRKGRCARSSRQTTGRPNWLGRPKLAPQSGGCSTTPPRL